MLPVVGWLALFGLFVYPRVKAIRSRSPSRSGDRPQDAGRQSPPTGTSRLAPDPPRREQPTSPAQESSDSLRAALESELGAGRALANTLSTPFGSLAFASIGLSPQSPRSPRAAVDDWESRVAHLLNKAEQWELADYFLVTAPRPAPSLTLMTPDMLADLALRLRLDFRLTRLNTIIKRKL